MLTLLRSLIVVAEHGSYTRAAERLYLSQPTVYQHIRQLERLFGTRLVEQRGKRVQLTEHGRIAYSYARRIVDLEEELTQVLSDDATLSRGALVLAAGTTPGEFLLPRLCVGFQKQHPAVEFRIRIVNSPSSIDRLVARREVDLGFHSDPTPANGVVKEPFVDDTLTLIVPRGHKLAGCSGVRPCDVANEPFVRFEASFYSSLTRIVDEWFVKDGVSPRSIIMVDSLQAVKEIVRAGGGIAIVSQHAVCKDDQAFTCVPLHDPPRRSLYMVSRDSGWESHLLHSFREFVLSSKAS